VSNCASFIVLSEQIKMTMITMIYANKFTKFHAKKLTKVKIFPKSFRRSCFFETLCSQGHTTHIGLLKICAI